MMTIKKALANAYQKLKTKSPTPLLDAQVLLSFLLNTSSTHLYTYSEDELSEMNIKTYDELIDKRAMGIPVSYLTKIKEFWSLPLCVNEYTLIPRPESEMLVELVLNYKGVQKELCLLDLGTGSGALALAIASEKPNWDIVASDISSKALQIAQQNVDNLNINNVRLVHSDWFSDMKSELFDVIVANPPYLAVHDRHLIETDIRHEPLCALTSGENGLDALIEIIAHGKDYLTEEGFLLVEHGYNQESSIYFLFTQHGYNHIQHFKDLNGHSRVTIGWKNSSKTPS